MLSHRKRGAALLSIWTFFGCSFVAFFLPFGALWLRQLICLAAALVSYPFFFLRLCSARITVTQKEFSISRGILLIRKKKLPLRFLTGITIFSSPLQRLFGVCTLSLYTNGNSVVLFSLDRDYARQLYDSLQQGGAFL